MAGAKPGVHVVQLKPVHVPEALVKGNKFIRWEEDSTVGTPVTLKVDSNGYILYWKDQVKEMDSLDISLIRDTRTGKYAKVPKDPKMRDSLSMGSADVALEDKTLTVCYGTDLVNLNFINFAANSREVAKEWCDALFQFATNLLASNSAPMTFLLKCYTKLVTIVNTEGKIPVRNVVKMFATHKDDRKKVEKALEAARLPYGKSDMIHPSKFSFEDFMALYRHLCGRQEVEKIFHELGAKKKPYLTAEQFVEFINSTQRDRRLNEILYPYCDVKRAQALINQFEPNQNMASKDPQVPKGHLSLEGFMRYLLSEENALIPPEVLDLNEDMEQPLSHYFINSSHNTYLTGHQFTGKSSIEIYRQVLLTGCRCVELDCWDGKGADEEPIITHGYTMCTEIVFKEVIEAISESAFKVSDYPVILSFENHCSPKQQAKMAQHCRNILGEALLTDPLETHPLDPGVCVPSPALLKGRIIVKNKKRHIHKSKAKTVRKPVSRQNSKSAVVEGDAEAAESSGEGGCRDKNDEDDIDGEKAGDDDPDLSSESDLETGQEAEAGMEMSALVNYIQPARFHSFEYADKRGRSYECNSFVETQATALLKEFPVEFVNFNKRQLSRIYPKGTRVDSSNYMPQIFWNAGCQLVALNYQTLDLPMQLNLGIFEYNGRSGFILKPDFMRRKDKEFDPFAESTVDGIVAGTVEVKVISGQFLTDRKVGTCVEVDMYGLPADTVRKKFKTKVIPGNGVNPLWDEDAFIFRKVVLPNLATLRFCAQDENGRLLGHRILPVEGIRPGYRHISLRNELNQPSGIATLFVYIRAGDYVPDALAEFAAAIENPIAYQSKLEKHALQLAVLEEDDELNDV
ncbi:hypothetical protein CAPTEDRAFT_170497 [Capitella teleta]|uniref:Phosphoinositide phospholipase C n=1 Tax=Capitella teleta TaxID=283909 RepID=R7UBY3_CAPTE|nr:hypothetical protein CAPTEDRAFT_170497 [Capitella teleta]|eukprot:ELU03479.1 hypothetical protein CAPTEDRAFT_170497 [Capitella teleta]